MNSSSLVHDMSPLHLHNCYECNKPASSKPSFTHQNEFKHVYHWLEYLYCDSCDITWGICKFCTSKRTHLLSNKNIKRHNTDYHSTTINNLTKRKKQHENIIHHKLPVKKQKLCSIDISNDKLSSTNSKYNGRGISTSVELYTILKEPSISQQVCFQHFKQNNKLFFENHHNEKGYQTLVHKSLCDSSSITPSSSLSEDFVDLHMNLTKIVYKLPKTSWKTLIDIINGVVKNTTNQIKSLHNLSRIQDIPNNLSIPFLPQAEKDLRRQYEDGKNSIYQNLPRPTIHTCEDHAYVSIIDVISIMLGYGIYTVPVLHQQENSNLVDNIMSSKAAQNVLINSNNKFDTRNQPILNIIVCDWHDDFEPNSQSKQNRGSVWTHSVTIGNLNNVGKRTLNTHVLAVGHKGSDHEFVLNKFKDDMKVLSSSENKCVFYHGGLKQMVQVYAEHFLSLADSPERRSSCGIMLGTSNMAPRWSYAMNVSSFHEKVPACKKCLEKDMLHMKENESLMKMECDKCINWDFDTKSNLSKFDAPKNYPEELSRDGKLYPKKLTYQNLVDAKKVAHDNIKNSVWTKQQATAYLISFSLNMATIEEIIQLGMNVKDFEDAKNNKEHDQKYWKDLNEEKNKSPHLFEEYHNSKWINDDMNCPLFLHQIDAPMHLIMYGVGGSLMESINDYLIRKRKKTAFQQLTVELIRPIRDMNLQWCKVMPNDKGTYGGWVCENYSAYLRLLLWINSPLLYLKKQDSYKDPSKPINQYDKQELTYWLKVRGQSYTNGDSIKILKKRVQELKKENIKPLPPSGGPFKNLFNILVIHSYMMSLLMSDVVDNKSRDQIDGSIKLFLSLYAKFDTGMKTKEELKPNKNGDRPKPQWLNRSNFLSLLNLPDIMRKFGPIKLYWEGEMMGEGHLKGE